MISSKVGNARRKRRLVQRHVEIGGVSTQAGTYAIDEELHLGDGRESDTERGDTIPLCEVRVYFITL